MRTGSEAIAASRAARWEIDLSAGARSSPDSPRAGSKRMFMMLPSCPGDREAEVGDHPLGPRGVIVAFDPQGDDALAVVLRRREGHVDDVDAGAAERQGDLGDHPGTVGHGGPQLVDRLAAHAPGEA